MTQYQITITKPVAAQTLVERLINRALIRRNDANRLSVKEGKPDKLSCLLEEAADQIMHLENEVAVWKTEACGIWPGNLGPYKELVREVSQLREQNAALREDNLRFLRELLETKQKLEDYRDLDAMLCK